MGSFIVKRAVQTLVVLVGVTLGTFLLLHLTPGDPARLVLGPRASAAAVDALRAQLGLDDSLPQQYFGFVGGALHLDFGDSISLNASVRSVLGARLGVTLLLTVYATVLAVVLAVPLAIWSALRRNRLPDHVVRIGSMVTFAMPPFWLGLLLILILSVQLKLFPTSGYGEGFAGHIDSLTLPALTLALGLAPILLRTLRSSMIDALGREYVEAARARGVDERRVIVRYVLRNSLVSSVTVLGVNIGYLFGGVVVVENVFALPGLGSLLVQAVQHRDFPVVQALALLFAFGVILVNTLTDLAYVAIDPRVRL